ncbi:MAG TPA: cyanophycinase [Thermoanaerobaculales bacterium]|nr:cyanophycinase [Thermoanaerobaculales bacterium]HPA79698.1 cyanophycinase [Thermoanaerobaculales bacterium]HQL31026.1 cyanophycinase [Thermoanaerobaculales bacterium]HQN95468.1 cyanophycinase [Thermoanaerobaculales bacterium]HQP42203.1 cyanophycinase [Thermoanaerobaculales bacterium]
MRSTLGFLTSLALAALTAASVMAGPPPKGHLVLIGGGDKPADAMAKFIELAGGPQAPMVAIPTASTDSDVGYYYTDLFREQYGCPNVVTLDIKNRADAARPDFVERAAAAGGIFFGGGDQALITRAILDTPVGDAIAAAFARGAVVGGTSAGTACQSPLMITGEGDFTVIRAGSVELWRGFGFFRDVIVDQHFIARQRSNRLISVILEHPWLLGVGVDEDTAVWVRPDGTFQVLGDRCVMVVDANGATVSRLPGTTGQEDLGVHDLKIHVVLRGEVFDLKTRTVLVSAAVESGDRDSVR